ncbi:TniQ family protein [Rhizobium ruizarguesonis]
MLMDVPLFNDETLLSYLSRLAVANAAGTSRTFCNDLGLSFRGLVRGDAAWVEKLARLVGRSASDLMRHNLQIDNNGGTLIAGAYFSKTAIRRSSLRYCPQCLAEDQRDGGRMPGTRLYGRLLWILPQVTACPTHAVEIVQSDGAPVRKHEHDFTAMMEVEGDDVGSLLRKAVPAPTTEFDAFVVDRLGGVRRHGAFLDSLALSPAMMDCELIGLASKGARYINPRAVGPPAMTSARAAGYASLSEGWKGFEDALDRVRLPVEKRNVRGGKALYGSLYSALNDGHAHPDFDPLRKAIRDHTLKVIPVLNGADFFGKVEDSDWTSVSMIARATGYADQTLRRILVELGHLKTLRQAHNDSFVRREMADEAVAIIRDMATLEDAAEIMGLDPRTLKRLVDDGFVKHAFLPTSEQTTASNVRPRFSRAYLVGLRDALLAKATRPVRDHMVSFGSAAKRGGLRYAQVLALILEGKLAKVARIKDEPGLAALRLDWREVGLFKRRISKGLSGAGRSAPGPQAGAVSSHGNATEVAANCKRIRLSPRAFDYLCSEKLLEADGNPLSMKTFGAKYVTLQQCSRETGVPAVELRSRIVATKIRPAFPLSKVGQYIIKRDHVSKLLV